MKKKDIIFGGFFLLICVILFLETRKFPVPIAALAAPPSFWPRIILTLLTVMLAVLIIRSFLFKGDTKDAGKAKSVLTKENIRVVSAIAATLLFLFLFKRVGYIISIFMFYLVSTYIMEPTKSVKAIAMRVIQAAILVASIYFIFGKGLSVQLPSGDLFN